MRDIDRVVLETLRGLLMAGNPNIHWRLQQTDKIDDLLSAQDEGEQEYADAVLDEANNPDSVPIAQWAQQWAEGEGLDPASTDALHWAQQFCKRAEKGFDPSNPEHVAWLASWFANFWAAVHDPLAAERDTLQAELDKAKDAIANYETACDKWEKRCETGEEKLSELLRLVAPVIEKAPSNNTEYPKTGFFHALIALRNLASTLQPQEGGKG